VLKRIGILNPRYASRWVIMIAHSAGTRSAVLATRDSESSSHADTFGI
jgi:hypothetical protein